MKEKPLPRRRNQRPRLGASVYGGSGYAVHLIIGAYKARPILTSHPQLAQTILQALTKSAVAHGVTTYCYCLMPDHLHIVAAVESGDSDLERFVRSLKKRATLDADTGKGPLWQRSFYDRAIRPGEDLREICLYVLNNPVRQEIVEDWHRYPYAWLSPEVGS